MKNIGAVKRFWPLILTVGVWLVVLLVPPLNLLFRVQVGGSAIAAFSVLPARNKIENAPNFWEKSARRFPDDANVLWQAAKEYPVSEQHKVAAEYSDLAEDIGSAIPAPPSAPAPITGPPFTIPVPTPDPSLPPSPVFPGQLEGDPNAETMRRLDLLIARFPGNADFIAARLRATFVWMKSGRVGGELSDIYLQENQKKGISSPERSQFLPNFSAADLQKALALAERGGKIEPDNAFFDWAKCCFLLHAWRDAEAFQALEAAGKKRRFDDHLAQQHRAENAAMETVCGHKLLAEEKTINLPALLLPHLSPYRAMARIISWQAIKAQRRGDHRQTLRISAGLARIGALMRNDAFTFVEGSVGNAIESIGWGGPTYDARIKNGSGIRGTVFKQRILSFEKYAINHGQPELAKEAARSYLESAKFQALMASGPTGGIYDIPMWIWISISLLWVSGVLLLMHLLSTLLSAALIKIASRVGRVRGVLRLQEMGEAEILSSREVWNGALACSGLRALMTALCAAIVAGLCSASILIGIGEIAQVQQTVSDYWNGITRTFGSSSDSEFSYYMFGSIGQMAWEKRLAIAMVPLILGILFAAWRATEWQKSQSGEDDFHLRPFLCSLFQGRIFQSPTGARDDFDLGGAFRQLADWILMLLLIAAWVGLASMNNTGGSKFVWLIPVFLICFFSGLLLGEKFLIWRARPRRRAAMRFGLRLLSRSLSAWIILGSVLYVVLLLVSLPLRNRVETQIDRVLRLGEIGAAKSN